MLRTKNLIWTLASLLTIATFAGCGDDSNTGGSPGGGTANITAEEAAAGACDGDQADPDMTCTGVDEYNDCVETSCAAGYEMCLGAKYKSGDYTGGACETYMNCLKAAPNKCENTCSRDSACTSCFTSNFLSCTSGCTLPMCMMNAAGTSGGTAGTSGGGTAGTVAAGDKTCDDLLACCNTLEETNKATCTQVANQYKALGAAAAPACNAAYTTFCPQG